MCGYILPESENGGNSDQTEMGPETNLQFSTYSSNTDEN